MLELPLPIDPNPPPEPRRVYTVAGIGLAVTAVAAALGIALDASGSGGGPSALSAFRLVLVAGGTLTVGAAVSMRATLPLVWLFGAGAAFLASFGLPEHWDSARMLARVTVYAALTGALLAWAPVKFRYAAVSLAVVYHFFGIFLATTWPDPTPWFTQQVGTRVYLPYIQFMYLKNAYHFYSPEPGSASHLFCLVVYDATDPQTGKPEAKWVTMPSREHNWKDPMGLSYFRRLSLTEQASGSMPQLNPQSDEWRDINARRRAVAQGAQPNVAEIPLAPLDTDPNQYRMPRYDISRYLLPSYAAHLMHAYSTPEKKVASVKIYRLDHPIPNLYQFSQENWNPHHPIGFKPFYLGEFVPTGDGDAVLKDKQDPMLYWMTPILPKLRDAKGREYEDFMSKHAKYEFNWEARMP
ncbi:hypothetical protein [Limnoglobus roseus]|uniref:Magnesium transporter n=1 Tax=Limnoglobus roseus TaxID=2598579 RepID=A0A5C1A5V7_9BACT|nr:hypothetical protein [Limnoglobus roseus]QEL13735.1 magnesium transporter [Limnoglobus roseus]